MQRSRLHAALLAAASLLAGPGCDGIGRGALPPPSQWAQGSASEDPPPSSSSPTPSPAAPDELPPPSFRTPREAYEATLGGDARASSNAAAWRSEGTALLQQPQEVQLPLLELVAFGRTAARGASYAFTLRQGQRVRVELRAPEGDDPTEPPSDAMFVDLHAAEPDAIAQPVAHADGAGLAYEAGADGRFVLRLQPALHYDHTVRVAVRVEPSLAFPVLGKDRRAVQSFFGAPRDGGRRAHHGIDIFAPRGTHALASADAVVTHVGQSKRGGNVVWLRDLPRGLNIYYAHLARPLVEPGQRVAAGDPVGEIGNSGNARGGKPHLHFGLYRHGPVDPLPFVHTRRRTAPAPRLTAEAIDRPHVVRRSSAPLREAPGPRESIVATPGRGAVVTPLAVHGQWLRVRLDDATEGWISSRMVQPAPSDPTEASPTAPG